MKAPERVPGVHNGKNNNASLGAGFTQAAAGKAAHAGDSLFPEKGGDTPGRGAPQSAEKKPVLPDKVSADFPQGLGAAKKLEGVIQGDDAAAVFSVGAQAQLLPGKGQGKLAVEGPPDLSGGGGSNLLGHKRLLFIKTCQGGGYLDNFFAVQMQKKCQCARPVDNTHFFSSRSSV